MTKICFSEIHEELSDKIEIENTTIMRIRPVQTSYLILAIVLGVLVFILVLVILLKCCLDCCRKEQRYVDHYSGS